MEESIIPQMKKTMHDLLEIENSFCELTGMLVTHDLEIQKSNFGLSFCICEG